MLAPLTPSPDASADGIDVDERTGCKLPYLGVVLAPCFPLVLGLCASVLKARRARLNDGAAAAEGLHLGRTWLVSWVDRIPLAALIEQPGSFCGGEASEGRSASQKRSKRFATDLAALESVAGSSGVGAPVPTEATVAPPLTGTSDGKEALGC